MSRAILSDTKDHENAFLVCLVKTPALPSELARAEFFHELAVIAINDTDGDGKYGGAHLSADEKECIGSELIAWDTPLDKWTWCTLYES